MGSLLEKKYEAKNFVLLYLYSKFVVAQKQRILKLFWVICRNILS
jgi:hypothetical protein